MRKKRRGGKEGILSRRGGREGKAKGLPVPHLKEFLSVSRLLIKGSEGEVWLGRVGGWQEESRGEGWRGRKEREGWKGREERERREGRGGINGVETDE